MQYDPDLAERLAAYPTVKFSGEIFRATRPDADPLAPSVSGGRWAWPQNAGQGTSVLYASTFRDGAIAEVVSFLINLTPVPKRGQLKISKLSVSTSRTLRLAREDLIALNVNMDRYGDRDYSRTQEIGSTLAWLGVDSLIAPSARWACDNFIIFTNNHTLNEKLETLGDELIEWREWAESNGFIKFEA